MKKIMISLILGLTLIFTGCNDNGSEFVGTYSHEDIKNFDISIEKDGDYFKVIWSPKRIFIGTLKGSSLAVDMQGIDSIYTLDEDKNLITPKSKFIRVK